MLKDFHFSIWALLFWPKGFQRLKWSEFLIILNSKAHLIWPKSAQKGAQYFFPKKSHIFGKRRTIFDPPNNFYCIFIHEFFGDLKNLKIFIFYKFFFFILSYKGLFYDFTKAHKKFSRSHLTLNVAPMCSKAHTINHSVGIAKRAESFPTKKIENCSAYPVNGNK